MRPGDSTFAGGRRDADSHAAAPPTAHSATNANSARLSLDDDILGDYVVGGRRNDHPATFFFTDPRAAGR